jgi:membrane-bound serine protease (ClpP class)
MDLWIVIALYVFGLGLIITESMVPGMIMGLIGTGSVLVSVFFGFRHHWALGSTQVVVALVVGPLAIYLGIRRLTLKTTLEGSRSFAQDYAAYLGKEGQTQTDLRPAGIVEIEGRKLDVVTAGELVEKSKRVRVMKVEGNRIVVQAVREKE